MELNTEIEIDECLQCGCGVVVEDCYGHNPLCYDCNGDCEPTTEGSL